MIMMTDENAYCWSCDDHAIAAYCSECEDHFDCFDCACTEHECGVYPR